MHSVFWEGHGYDCPNLRLVRCKTEDKIHRIVFLKLECILELPRGLVKAHCSKGANGKRTLSTKDAGKTGYPYARK